MINKPKSAERIAFRVEGNLWCAYYAKPNTMVDALFLASINLSLVKDVEFKNRFMHLIQDALGNVFSANGHKVRGWSCSPAPEHERAGNA